MCALAGGWTVPDFGVTASRPRLVAMMCGEGTRPSLVFGGSGTGKSVLVRDYVTESSLPAFWIDAAGEPLTAQQVAVALVRAFGESESPRLTWR